jgi:hypothetical protein
MNDKRLLAGLAAFLLLNLGIVLWLHDSIPAVAALYPEVPAGAHWFDLQHAGLLYAVAPLVITATIVTLLAPGLLIVLAARAAENTGELLLKGFGVAYVLHFLTTSVTKAVSDTPLDADRFLMLLAASVAASYGLLLWRARRGPGLFGLLADPRNRAQLYWPLVIPFLFIIPLLPAIFWMDLNADGFEAMEIGMSLATKVLPVFPTTSGTMGLGIGMVPMAYPVHWFITLFGPIEAATRLPMVLYTVVLFAGLLSLIEYRAPRRLRPVEQMALLVAMAGYVTAMSFNSGYDNYFTDMSSPAAYETLTILLMIGSAYFLWSGKPGWFLLFTVLGFLARPTMLLVVVLFGASIWLTAPDRRRASLVMIGTAILVWTGLLLGYEHLFLPALSGGQAPDYSSASIINRFQYLTFTDLHRFLYAAAPAGVLPALALLAYRWQDPLARSIALVSAGYFLVFYIPAFTSLHHFVPVMILPLVVLWRVILGRTEHRWPALVAGAGAAVFVWLSLPQHFEINRTYRDIGSRTAYLIGDYRGDFDAYREAILGARNLHAFFGAEAETPDPGKELIGGFQQLYYARHTDQPASDTNYLVLPAHGTAPPGFEQVGTTSSGSAWVRDRAVWHADRYNPPATGFRSPLYAISRETSFFFMGIPAGNYDFNLSSLPLVWRLFRRQ